MSGINPLSQFLPQLSDSHTNDHRSNGTLSTVTTKAELAWLAGLLEGEGSFTLLRVRGTGPRNRPVIKVAMTDLDVVQRARDIAGFGVVSTARPNKKGCVMHAWQSMDRELAPKLMRKLLPYMGERRSRQIGIVLAGAAPYGWDGTRRSLRRSDDQLKARARTRVTPRVTVVG